MAIPIFRRFMAIAILCYWALASSAALTGYQKRNYDTISAIYNRTVYPTNLEFIANGSASVPPGLFNPNATGRITPVGNFSGFDDSTEYFFALAPIPQPPSYDAFTKAEVVEFTSGSPDVAASVVYFTSSVVNPNATNNGEFINYLKQVAFWRFDEKGAVLKYDAWIPNVRLYGSTTTPGSGPGTVAPPSPEVQASIIQTLCGTTQQLCTGANTQYNSTEDCVRTLSQRRFGDLDNIWDDNVTCRRIHILLARIRPEIHCPHVGPTGGGKCVPVSYNDVYFKDDVELFGEPEGQAFFDGFDY
ncbi:MAG: hypothetical protein Q9167_007399 [Letrouitia subvulpina]